MQTFEDLILQNCSIEFCNIAHGPWICVIKVCSSGYKNNVKLYNITIIVHYNGQQVSIRPVGLVLFVVTKVDCIILSRNISD